MRNFCNLLFFILSVVFLGACNTLYNTHTIKIEVVEPAKILLPDNYKNIAVRYNNCNVEYHPQNSLYQEFDSIRIDSVNSDSISSEIYYQLFLENLKSQKYFKSITEIESANYTGISLIDSLVRKGNSITDSTVLTSEGKSEDKIRSFVDLINSLSTKKEEHVKSKIIDPQLGLYSKEELKNIADSTGSEALFSLDFYSSFDGIQFYPQNIIGGEYVFVVAFWNIYDLDKLEHRAFQPKIDTISWRGVASSPQMLRRNLPPRNDAIFNAADIAGTNFAAFLIPHWIEEQRFYYYSGHIELKKTKKLIEENKWMEAAEIWKANVNNRNKSISAKSKFNMGLVCEIQGDYEAALDWVVQSYHVFGSKNAVHDEHCRSYINILALRKLKLNIIDKQYFVDDVQILKEQ